MRLHTVLAAVLLLSAAACGGGDGKPPPEEEQPPVVTTIQPGQGISIQQVDFDYPGQRVVGSTWGRLLIEPGTLSQAAGLRGGYVSLVTSAGWAAVNVPVPGVEDPPLAVHFDLGLAQPTEIGETFVEVKHSNQALADIRQYLTERIGFAVEKVTEQAYGLGPLDEMEKVLAPTEPPKVFKLSELPGFVGLTFSNLQAITNIQCAVCQCFPMATANGLQFLEDEGWLTLPHDHAMGLGIVGTPAGNTLVGQLDLYSARPLTSRSSGEGVWFAPMIEGTFEYLQDHGLDGILDFRHQDRGYGETIPAGDYTAFGSTSVDDGATVAWSWIDGRIVDGCAVTLIYIPHAVRVTGSGRTLGTPWIRYSHDSVQQSDSTGLEDVYVTLTDPDSDGLLEMGGSSREVRWVWAACP